MIRRLIHIHGVVETSAGLALIFFPIAMYGFNEMDDNAVIVSRLYGILALSVGLISIILANDKQISTTTHIKIAWVITAFQFGIGFGIYGLYDLNPLMFSMAALFHIVLGCIFLFGIFKNKP